LTHRRAFFLETEQIETFRTDERVGGECPDLHGRERAEATELAFRLATIGAFREAFLKTKPVILEPIMTVEVVAPVEFQSAVIGGLNARRGTIIDSEVREDEFTAIAEVALNDMFGYSSQLRGATQGKGEFSMEYKNHMPVLPNVQVELQEAYRKSLPHNNKK